MKEKSFDFAYEIIKQIITISTILLGVSLTFFEKFNYLETNTYLIIAWIMLLVSIVGGLFVMMGITGSLAKNDINASIYEPSITVPMMILIVIFGTAILFMILHTVKIINHKKEPEKEIIYKVRDLSFEEWSKQQSSNKNCCTIPK